MREAATSNRPMPRVTDRAVKAMADVFHMNIEEVDIGASLGAAAADLG